MTDQRTRRSFITAAGVSAAALAGCSSTIGSLGPLGNGEDDPSGTDTPTSTNPTSTPTGTPNHTPTHPSFERGEVLHDMEKLDDWGTIIGDMEAVTDNPYKGSQALRVSQTGDSSGVFTAYTDGLDLSTHDMSVAFKLESPAEGRLSVDFLAPGRDNHALARRYIPKQLNGWVRFDLGYVNERGTPNMDDVQEVRFVVHPNDSGKDTAFQLDDIRLIPKDEGGSGKVMFTFDDNFASQYKVAFPELQDRGWKGVLGTIPDEIGQARRMNVGELREMRDAGWELAAHPQLVDPTRPLPTLSPERQREVIERTNEKLEVRGFPDASKYFVTPFDRMGDATLDIVQDVYEQGYIFGAGNNGILPSGRHNISRVYGTSAALEGTWRQVKLASRRNQLAVLAFHDIGEQGAISKEDFTWLLDTIEDSGLEVVLPSDLQQQYDGLSS